MLHIAGLCLLWAAPPTPPLRGDWRVWKTRPRPPSPTG